MEKFDPYQFVQDRKQFRPFNVDMKRDGNFNYMHETDVWSLIERIKKDGSQGKFIDSVACNLAEGVEFMTKSQLYDAIKKDFEKYIK